MAPRLVHLDEVLACHCVLVCLGRALVRKRGGLRILAHSALLLG